MNNKTAQICLFLVAIVWGTGFVATHIALETGVTPYYLMSIRFLIAAVVVFAAFFKRIIAGFKSHFKAGSILHHLRMLFLLQ